MLGTSEHRLADRRLGNGADPFGRPFDVVGDRPVAVHTAMVRVEFEDLAFGKGFLLAFDFRDLVGHDDHQLTSAQVLDLASNGNDSSHGLVPQGRAGRIAFDPFGA